MPKQKRSFAVTFSGGATPSGAKGGLGQHFLKNLLVVKSIVKKAGIQPTDIVMEIGPGAGVLTFQMLPLCKKLIAVEMDPRMVVELQKKAANGTDSQKLKIIQGDVLKTELPYFNLLVANIPYKISSPLVFKLLSHRPIFRSAVIMFQEEFAQRLTAKPGDNLYCRLSVNVQLLSTVTQVLKVGRSSFRPPPKVDSRVVRITPKTPLPDVDFVEWDGMVRLCFNRKNKTLNSALTTKSVLKLLEANYRTFASVRNMEVEESLDMKAKVQTVLNECEMSDKRASKLALEDFMLLLHTFNTHHIRFT